MPCALRSSACTATTTELKKHR